MGACCSCHIVKNLESIHVDENGDQNIVVKGDLGAHVLLRGSSKYVSMFTQKGNKGINQDSMTVWENFSGDREMTFCGVFDGHGPSGHVVSRYVRDNFPSKLSSFSKRASSPEGDIKNVGDDNGDDEEYSKNPFYSKWKGIILNSYKEMDEILKGDASMESYCSGTTAVTVYKKGGHMIIANLGDSRAVLCTRDAKNQITAEQLTVDLKPNIPSEAERIIGCQGRVMAMVEEPNVYRVWMPDEDCPGLAMSRGFGDFCLKDYGLISTPQLFYRKITAKDEFVVLATDGVWDVLPNDEVVTVVATTRKRSLAAKKVVERAVRAWSIKYPNAKVDDCAVVCLFFKTQPRLIKSSSDQLGSNNIELGAQSQRYGMSMKNDDGLDTILNYNASTSIESRVVRKRYTLKRFGSVKN